MILGYYYLHENKELIYKPGSDSIVDIRDSDLCHSAWPIDPTNRSHAWDILVEANALGANKNRIQELAEKWGCDNEDAEHYAKYIGIEIGMDGDAYFARRLDFVNQVESPIGFGESYLEAMSELAKELGYKGGKMWNATFKTLVK